MAKKKLTQEEKNEFEKIELQKRIEQNLESEKLQLISCCQKGFIPYPTRIFSNGQEVRNGAHQKTVVLESAEDNRIYLIEHDYIVNKPDSRSHGSHFTKKRWVIWVDLLPKNFSETKIFSKKDDLDLTYFQSSISSFDSIVYFFGINLNPDYQRGLVWELSDKIKLIDSIFNNVDIGKFVFVRRDFDVRKNETPHLFEVLDGKQRLSTIMEFIEGRFRWNGFLFSELHPKDQSHLKNYKISRAEIDMPKDKNVLYEFFLKLNTTGKPMKKSHFDKVKGLIKNHEGL